MKISDLLNIVEGSDILGHRDFNRNSQWGGKITEQNV